MVAGRGASAGSRVRRRAPFTSVCCDVMAVVCGPQFEVWDKEATGNDKLLCGVATSFMGWIGKGSFEGDLVLKDEKVRAA
jgi:hypothetical protein